MKTLQQELIDFCKWQDKQIRVSRLPEWERLVNAYLKSINSNSAGERRAIGSNEAKEECCPNCSLSDAVHEIKYNVLKCARCGWLWAT